MSRFSGKCDLYDHIGGKGGWYDKDGNPVKFGQEGVHVYYSDEMKDFEAFKKKTGGILHQHHEITVTKRNLDFVKEHCEFFEERAGEDGKPIYVYFGKEYEDLKALNKHGVFIDKEIQIDTILDLIPYYPYIVAAAYCNKDVQHIVISKRSYVDDEEDELIQAGFSSTMAKHYRTELQKHYLEVCQTYLLKDLDERMELHSIKGAVKAGDDYEVALPVPADINMDAEYFDEGTASKKLRTGYCWSSPKFKDENTILVSAFDYEGKLAEAISADEIYVSYVKKLPEDYISIC